MNQAILKSHLRSRPRSIGIAAISIGLALSVSPSWGQNVIDADADGILVAMTNHLKSLQAFTVDYDTDHEIVDLAGQKLQYSASGSVQASRGDGFHMTRKGPFADVELTFDGKVISVHGKGMNVYAQLDSPGASIDEAVEEFRVSTGLDVAGADFLVTDPYAVLTEGVTSGRLVGDAFVGGVECDQLAFRNDAVDWQIWISKGDQKLPVKYVVTTKWVTGAPQYSLRFSNWKAGEVDAELFSFKPPANAKKLERIDSDEVGELVLEGSK
ncbi:DUF2092 domain-containing protein [Mesorhizobium mediterraneum]|uniref:DUF2092 domain-containing protein n=1 Tax=Mesorhizobium mediterraneum TaxID=43617 RepID=A0AB36R4Y5_9HYPH|nr:MULTISPECIES: DUF2092 domain-containing protein [Mesorhizobium]AZO68461.1 DUF2092 domain-containing protein [Mesorhizobium sp. M6A.T.Cr.TU.016.01.1.1]PAP99858.1 hypothetical protein CIT25_22685 [Mesorhizobium mediterraneum]RWN36247.1 MAG: DUF2092 domain-containing protein [Mesorhizobium sp.]RWP54825.1 MAG: DUF2092 domain-containing protein [Mesorhizobium sp.]RWP70770.1 MAG: DUF2092 domain-containing protein [Mesorhizobium sp.]